MNKSEISPLALLGNGVIDTFYESQIFLSFYEPHKMLLQAKFMSYFIILWKWVAGNYENIAHSYLFVPLKERNSHENYDNYFEILLNFELPTVAE